MKEEKKTGYATIERRLNAEFCANTNCHTRQTISGNYVTKKKKGKKNNSLGVA